MCIKLVKRLLFLHKVGTGSYQRVEKLYCLQSYDLRGVMCGMRGRYACVPTLRRKLVTSWTGLKNGCLDNIKYSSHTHLFIVYPIFGWSQWPRGLRRGSAAARLPGVWVWIPPGQGCHLWVLSVVRYRSLRRADHSSRGDQPSVLCLVWLWGLDSEEALAHWGGGLLRHGGGPTCFGQLPSSRVTDIRKDFQIMFPTLSKT